MKVILLLLLSTFSLFAQSLEQIVKEGLKNDPNIQSLTYDYRLAVKDLELVDAHYRPTLDVSAFIGIERTQSPQRLSNVTVLTTEKVALSGKYNLFSGYKKKYLLREKELAVKLSENKLKEALINLSQEISFAYIHMLKSYYVYTTYQKNITNYKETLRKVQIKIDDGGEIDSNLYQVKSRLNYAETNLNSALMRFEDSKIALAKYIKRTPYIKNMKDPRTNSKDMNLKRLIKGTKKYNATLDNLILQKKISCALVGQEKSNYYPQIDLEVSENLGNNLYGSKGYDHNQHIGVNLKYNIYNGGIDKLNIEKAQLESLKSGSTINDAKREILVNLKQLFNHYTMYKKKMITINTHLKHAKRTESLYVEEEEATGGRSIIDILNIQQEANAAMVSKIETKYTLIQLYYQLISNTSKILDYLKIKK